MFSGCGMSRWRYSTWTTGSGWAEAAAALLCAAFVIIFTLLLPFSLTFAGGAVLYAVSDELIPATHSHGHEHEATFGFVAGFTRFLEILQMLGWG